MADGHGRGPSICDHRWRTRATGGPGSPEIHREGDPLQQPGCRRKPCLYEGSAPPGSANSVVPAGSAGPGAGQQLTWRRRGTPDRMPVGWPSLEVRPRRRAELLDITEKVDREVA